MARRPRELQQAERNQVVRAAGRRGLDLAADARDPLVGAVPFGDRQGVDVDHDALGSADRVLVAPGLPWSVPGQVVDSGFSASELDTAAVVTDATLGIAETGTIVLTHGPRTLHEIIADGRGLSPFAVVEAVETPGHPGG